MQTRIELITPIITEGIRTLEEVEPFMRPDLLITQCLIRQGPASIESGLDLLRIAQMAQAIEVMTGHEHDVAAASAVTSVGTAFVHILLAMK